MIDNMIPFVASWLPFWTAYLIPVFCLCFVGWAVRTLLYLYRG